MPPTLSPTTLTWDHPAASPADHYYVDIVRVSTGVVIGQKAITEADAKVGPGHYAIARAAVVDDANPGIVVGENYVFRVLASNDQAGHIVSNLVTCPTPFQFAQVVPDPSNLAVVA